MHINELIDVYFFQELQYNKPKEGNGTAISLKGVIMTKELDH